MSKTARQATISLKTWSGQKGNLFRTMRFLCRHAMFAKQIHVPHDEGNHEPRQNTRVESKKSGQGMMAVLGSAHH